MTDNLRDRAEELLTENADADRPDPRSWMDAADRLIRDLIAALPAEQPASLTVGAPEAWRIEEFGKPTFVVMMAGRAEHYRRIGAKVTPLVPLSEADDDPAGRGGL